MQQEPNRFKLDAAFISIHRRPDERVAVYNFNIPVPIVQDPNSYQTVLQQLETDFPPNARGLLTPPYFQISATYTIVHSATNEERVWLGSFNPRARDFSQVTVFRPLDRESFVPFCLVNTQPNRVSNKLSIVTGGQDSMWTFGELKSIVVSVQIVLSTQHPIFATRPHLLQYDGIVGRQKRKVFRLYYD